MFFGEEGFTFRNFLMDALAIFVLIVWFWLLITIASDLFRRHDISGWAKALWVIVLVVAPYTAHKARATTNKSSTMSIAPE